MQSNTPEEKDGFARELGYESYAALPPQVQRNVDHSWPDVRVGSFQDLVGQLADAVEEAE